LPFGRIMRYFASVASLVFSNLSISISTSCLQAATEGSSRRQTSFKGHRTEHSAQPAAPAPAALLLNPAEMCHPPWLLSQETLSCMCYKTLSPPAAQRLHCKSNTYVQYRLSCQPDHATTPQRSFVLRPSTTRQSKAGTLT
jgi:hypothetical protein